MSLYLAGAEAFSPFPGIEVFNIGGQLSPDDFLQFSKELVIPSHVDMQGALINCRPNQPDGKVIEAQRSVQSPRDPWAPDHHWHSDKTYWGENPFASALYAQQLVGEVASTGFVDTSLLLEAIETDYPGISEELFAARAIFSVRRYYEDILPHKGSDEAIARTLEQFEVDCLEEVVEKECERYPEKTFPAIAPHPISTWPSIMTDTVRFA